MAYFMYNHLTGELKEVSEDLINDGCPLTGMAISFVNLTLTEIQNDYVWDLELRDFLPKI